MATNTLKPVANQPRTNAPRQAVETVVPEPVHTPEPAPAPRPTARAPRPTAAQPVRARSTWSVFTLLERLTRVDGFFQEGLPVRYLPHLLFVMFLTLVYIGNTHYATRMNRSIQKLKLETEDLRADYTTLSSDYMEASKQSEVARKVAAYGLVESSSPPFRITVPAGRLDEAKLEEVPLLTADSVSAMAARAKADSLRRAAALTLTADDSVAEAAPPMPIGLDVNGNPVPTTESSSNRSAPRRNERKR
ncbi:FtsL-like putative cell division protein [Hymenobacter fodinae]|uniref:FtsL-like putative cell division protein n=1 Tax=Hymenobacter fodinae TaxID=2510796 RepID=UPI001AEC5BCD|nr:FtsL-like putative cell division protein [Hymenobacter fodinae]